MANKLVFMGSSSFSVKILESLAESYTISGVVTQPDRPAGRGKVLTAPPVKILAEDLGCPIMQPHKLRLPEAFEQLAAWQPDLIIVAAYGQILRQNILDLSKFGCVNVHASYLPRWRGASPIQAAILNGDTFSGVTIMKMDAGIDTGPELAKIKIGIARDDDYFSLSEKLAIAGGKLLIQILKDYLENKLTPIAQSDNGVTYASMIKKEDGELDFNLPAEMLERKIRAYIEWPGTYLIIRGQLLKVRKAKVIISENSLAGAHTVRDGFPVVGTPDGDLMLLEVQPAGKKWMSGADYLRGFGNWIEN